MEPILAKGTTFKNGEMEMTVTAILNKGVEVSFMRPITRGKNKGKLVKAVDVMSFLDVESCVEHGTV